MQKRGGLAESSRQYRFATYWSIWLSCQLNNSCSRYK